jgi:hypothetical protein
LHVLTGLLGAWLYKKYGRKIRLEFNDLKVKATSVEEIERLLRVAQEGERGAKSSLTEGDAVS